MISDADSQQNAQIARIEANCEALGRSIDLVRGRFDEHEDRCRENWKVQMASNGKIGFQLKLILWVFSTLTTIIAGLIIENQFFGG